LKKVGWLSILVTAALLTFTVRTEAQQTKKVRRIGYLANTAATSSFGLTPFRERLHGLGYIEGQNLTIEYRFFEGKVERLPELVTELIRLNSEVIVVIGNEAVAAAKSVTKEIPIVMSNTNDAVGSGFVASMARPGGNITGVTGFGGEINGKRLELLKEIIPKLSHVGFLWSPTSPTAADNLKETESAARSLRVGIQSLEVKAANDFERVFQAAVAKNAEALLVDGGGFAAAYQKEIIALAIKHRIPTMYPNSRYVALGGLMSYNGDRSESLQRAAEFVDKILKGAKPADLPVERSKKFEFAINLKTAKQIGLTIPPNVLARADRVIK
jgi:ABC-type uncharacterized transport system substrate-binding protein